MFKDHELELSALKMDVLRVIRQESVLSKASRTNEQPTRSQVLAAVLGEHLEGPSSNAHLIACSKLNHRSTIITHPLPSPLNESHQIKGNILFRASCMTPEPNCTRQHPYHFKMDSDGYLLFRLGEQPANDEISDEEGMWEWVIQLNDCYMYQVTKFTNNITTRNMHMIHRETTYKLRYTIAYLTYPSHDS